MSRDVAEADLSRRAAQVIGRFLRRLVIAGQKPGNVDNRQFGEGGSVHRAAPNFAS